MEKERIEEMVDEFEQDFRNYLDASVAYAEIQEPYQPLSAEDEIDWLKKTFRKALTKAHQAGIDKAVEIVMPFLKAYKQSLDCDWEVNPVQATHLVYRSPETVLRDQADAIEAKRKMARDLDDTIEALQDNK